MKKTTKYSDSYYTISNCYSFKNQELHVLNTQPRKLSNTDVRFLLQKIAFV